MTQRALGVCYYPEQWPESQWSQDAQMMRDYGLEWVRIGEFAWSKIEPQPGQFNWAWLDKVIQILAIAGLKIVLGTPTATPPRWMLDKHPDMLAVDANGHPRKFGSRRHYCFSHMGYRDESRRITALLAQRYGAHPAILAWQTDNEYGCHDTTLSYSDAARRGFQTWLADQYANIDALNAAWGNVFWSMDYAAFDQIDLPNLTVTEANPAHRLAFRRFSSDQVVAFNRAQVEILRDHTDAPIIHNYMGRITDFDHFKVGKDLDVASWDSYPLGFLEDRILASEQFKRDFSQQGHPDFQAFHHDLYRAVGKGRWWVMEQQPGPVNWAPYNPAPLPGMVRLWTWEAFAHGAENVMYFRWWQAPFAQEQMHTGVLLPNGEPNRAAEELKQVVADFSELKTDDVFQAKVALIFDYESMWAGEIQPQGQSYDYFELVFHHYKCLRKLGISVDILSPDAENFDHYQLIFAPGLFTLSSAQQQRISAFTGHMVLGPRTNAKTDQFSIWENLPPNINDLDAKIENVESLRPDVSRALESGGAVINWVEHIVTSEEVIERSVAGEPAILRKDNLYYVAGWLDEQAMLKFMHNLLEEIGVAPVELPEGLRRRETATHCFYFNYANRSVEFGEQTIAPAGVYWQRK